MLGIYRLLSLIPNAVAWVGEQEKYARQVGLVLACQGNEMARSVGVGRPDLIRVVVAERLPLPGNPVLRNAVLSAGLLGPEMAGLTLGHSIFIRQGQLTSQLLSHECRHVYQYEVAGSTAEFLRNYITQIVTHGYYDAPLERDARAHEYDMSVAANLILG